MKKWLKITLWVVGSLIVVGGIIFFTLKQVMRKISVSAPRLTGLNLQGLTLNDLLNIALTGTEKEISVGLAIDLINNSNLSIPFSIYKIKLSQTGTTIAESSPALSEQRFVLPAKGKITISDTIRILLNTAAGNILVEKAKKNQVELQYDILFNVFGMPISFKGQSFKW